MFSSTLKVIACVFFVCFGVQAQNPAAKVRTGSISGKVIYKGNGIAGISVGARAFQSSARGPSQLVTITDQDGNYRIANVPSGEYEVMPAAPQFVLAGRQAIKRLVISEGENVEGIDFRVIRGGVITGKVIDADGQPLIEEPVEILGPEGPNSDAIVRVHIINYGTDDRGIYRAYGLPPGKYKVAAGTAEERLNYGGGRRTHYRQTFHPSATEASQATLVEVTEGGEVTNVDITLRRLQATFTISGRIIDDDGKPLADVRYGIEKIRENGSSATSGPVTNRLGEFRIENVTPGKYAVFLDRSSPADRDLYAEPVQFDIVNQDVTGLVIKATSGSSVSGVVVFEGRAEKVATMAPNRMMIFTHTMRESQSLSGGTSPYAMVNADGSFTVNGLRPGVVQFSVHAPGRGPMTEFEVIRVEREGTVQSRIEIKERERIKGLRLIVKARTGGIRGVVKIENGQGFQSERLYAQVKRVGDDKFGTSMQIDARGRFISPALSAGVYEVSVIAYGIPNRRGEPPSVKQQVVVSDDQVTEIVLTLDLKLETDPDPP